jgi:hypothetical protein
LHQFEEQISLGVPEEDEEDMVDERNDVYTAKGFLEVPVTAGTKSQSSLRGGGPPHEDTS